MCLVSMSLPRVAIGWFVICAFCIFWSYPHVYCDLVRKHPCVINDLCVLTTAEPGVKLRTVKSRVAVSAVYL